MKTIYFVRHGQTYFNRHLRHQYPTVELSNTGWKQAEAVGKYAKSLGLDIILASDLQRTRQTADVIGGETGVSVEYISELREYTRPSAVWGKSYFHPMSVWVMSMLLLHAKDPSWRYGDEETVAMFQDRIASALNLLATRPEERIMVVSHRGFITGALSLMQNGFMSHERFARKLARSLSIDNCSFTTMLFHDNPSKRWEVKQINDTSMLGTCVTRPCDAR